jgi:hypothetical protein
MESSFSYCAAVAVTTATTIQVVRSPSRVVASFLLLPPPATTTFLVPGVHAGHVRISRTAGKQSQCSSEN